MKKTLLIVAITVLALGVLGAGVAFAQAERPSQPYAFSRTQSAGAGGPGMMSDARGGNEFTHAYVVQVLAEKFGLSEAQVEDALANDASMVQLALDNGIAEADLPAFMNEVHQAAFDKAVADGAMTREQAGWMLERMGGMFTDGAGLGDCPMDGEQPLDGTGVRSMPGSRGGGRWGQTQP